MGQSRVTVGTTKSQQELREILRDSGLEAVLDVAGLDGAKQVGAETQELLEKANASFTVTRGDTLPIRTTVTMGDDDAAPPFDLTGCVIRSTAKRDVNDANVDALYQLTSETGGDITITDAVNGVIRVRVPPEATASLTATEQFVWDIQVTTPEGDVYTVDWGALTVNASPDVTRAS